MAEPEYVGVQRCNYCGGMFNDPTMHVCGPQPGVTYDEGFIQIKNPVLLAQRVFAFYNELVKSKTEMQPLLTACAVIKASTKPPPDYVLTGDGKTSV